MAEIDIRAIPDPSGIEKRPRKDRLQAKRLLASVPEYSEIRAEDRSAQIRTIAEAISLDPKNSHGWFNLGIHYKFAQRWEEAALCNRRSAQLTSAGRGEAEHWNLGIASTALHDWETARSAWSAFGIDLGEGTGPIDDNLGPSPVRIFSEETAEVVWGTRICPARICIENIPLPQSGHRWHDLILHDGAPNGTRTWEGQEFAVFDELERWQASDVVTLECLVTGTDSDIGELLNLFDGYEAQAENWTSTIRMLCETCSQGQPDGAHKHGSFSADAVGSTIGIAAPIELAEQFLDRWTHESPDRTRSDIFNAEESHNA